MQNKYILNEDQVATLTAVHKLTMENMLIRMDFPVAEHVNMMESAEKTFASIIQETQEKLTEIGANHEIMEEMKKKNDTE